MGDSNKTKLRYVKETSYAATPSGSRATGTVSFSVAPTNLDTVTVNGQVYTFKTGSLTTNNDVAAGASAAAAASNLSAAINADPTQAGTAFFNGTVANAAVSGIYVSGALAVTVEALTQGTAGNSITLAKSGTFISVSGATLSGGTTPIYSTATELRFNSESLKHNKVTVVSEEIRSDRTVFDMIEVGIGANGETNHELHYGDMNGLMQSAMMAPLTSTSSGTNTATNWSITGQVLSKAAAIPTGMNGAKYVKISGFANATNNGIKRVTAQSGNTFTLEGTFTNEAAGPSVSVQWAYSRQGTTVESYVIEKEVIDAKTVIAFWGMVVNTFNVALESRSKAMVKFGFIGYGGESRKDSVGVATASPSTNPIYNTSANVAQLLISGAASPASIRKLEFNVNNNLRERLALARKGSLQPGTGTAEITGTLEAYFTSKAMFDYFIAHSAVGLEFTMTDSGGRIINFYMPQIRFSEGNPSIGGMNQDVILPLSYQAVRGTGIDGTTFQAQIDFLS